jgi:hypothetical protein
MEQPLEQSLELVWSLFDFAFLSCCDCWSNYWSWSGPGVTLPLPVTEQILEQSLELVWTWCNFAFADHGANIGAIIGAGMELFRLCTRLSWSNRLSNHWSWSGAGVTLPLPVMERLMEQSLELIWSLSDFAFAGYGATAGAITGAGMELF